MPLDTVGFPAIGAPVLADAKDGSATLRFPGLPTEWQVQPQSDGSIIFATQTSGGGYLPRIQMGVCPGASGAGYIGFWTPNGGGSWGYLTLYSASSNTGIQYSTAIPSNQNGSWDVESSVYRAGSAGGFAWSGTSNAQASSETSLSRSSNGFISFSSSTVTATLGVAATATFQQGAANAASPVNQTYQAQGSRSGTDTNVGGANLTVASGQGTGTGTASSLIFQTPVVVASGTGAQTMTTALTLSTAVGAVFASDITSTAGDLYTSQYIRRTAGGPTIRFLAAILNATDNAGYNSFSLTATDCSFNANNRSKTFNVYGTSATPAIAVAADSTTTFGGPVAFPVYAVAALPAAASFQYCRVFVSDALTPAFGVAVVGGGAVKTPVYSDGSTWLVG